MSSLLNRLSLAMAVVLLGAGLLLVLVARDFPRQLVEDYVVARLKNDASLLYVHVHETAAGDDVENQLQQALGPAYQLPLSGHYFLVQEHGGPWLHSRSLWDEELRFSHVASSGGDSFRSTGPGTQPLIVFARRFPPLAERPAVDIYVTQHIAQLDAAIASFRQRLLLGLGIALLLLLWLQRRLLRQGLAPLHAAAAACRRIERGETLELEYQAPREVQAMLDALNRLARHNAQRLSRVRHALGNVSHALKTPLAILQQEVDELVRQGHASHADVIGQQLDSMRHTIERELRRARLAGGGVPHEGFEARSQLETLVQALRQLHAGRELEFHLDVARRHFALDREDMLELFGNLLDNACKWARRQIRIHIASADEAPASLLCTIDDDGPGVPAELRAQLGHSGVRGDEQRPGHGLGLLIVQDIITQYGGSIRYQNAPALGGLRVRIELPL